MKTKYSIKSVYGVRASNERLFQVSRVQFNSSMVTSPLVAVGLVKLAKHANGWSYEANGKTRLFRDEKQAIRSGFKRAISCDIWKRGDIYFAREAGFRNKAQRLNTANRVALRKLPIIPMIKGNDALTRECNRKIRENNYRLSKLLSR